MKRFRRTISLRGRLPLDTIATKYENSPMADSKLSPTVKASLELLGVDLGTSGSDLKKAYHRMALLYHPDRNPDPGSAKEFQKVTEAFELLTDIPRVNELNRRHLKERLHRQIVDGIEITFGSFFGFRLFDLPGGLRIEEQLLLKGQTDHPEGQRKFDNEKWSSTEESHSILDHAAYDSLEVVYAGKFSIEDEQRIKGEVEGRKLAQMPWVVLNNQGIIRYLEGDLKGSRKCYQELVERIPNNIIFMYRLGLCLILEGFSKPRRTLLGGIKPDRIKIEKGIALLKHCIKLGEEREVGRQKCLVIRKTLADVFERTGQSRRAKAVWRGILENDPRCAEAAYKIRGRDAALKIMRSKASRRTEEGLNKVLALTPSKR